jgi:hypothetical protein
MDPRSDHEQQPGPEHQSDEKKVHKQEVENAVSHVLEEGRMLLPGIETLFGFQLVATFSEVFYEKLSRSEQWLHLVAVGLVVICVALVLAPAAYHRQAEPDGVSSRLVRYASVLFTIAMFPLMVALCMDFYLIARLVTGEQLLSMVLAAVALVLFGMLWFVWPRWCRARRHC